LNGLTASGRLARLTAGEVTGAVVRESAAVSVSAAQYFICGLRAFLRFCFIEGIVEADLSRAALSLTGRRSAPLPHGIDRADAAALLGSCDRRTGVGRRDTRC
jgi:integrase/recombinase XerD